MASSDLDSGFDEIKELKELFERCGMRDTMFSHCVSLEDVEETPFLLAVLVLNQLPKLSYESHMTNTSFLTRNKNIFFYFIYLLM
jgi:hypothetical protein